MHCIQMVCTVPKCGSVRGGGGGGAKTTQLMKELSS